MKKVKAPTEFSETRLSSKNSPKKKLQIEEAKQQFMKRREAIGEEAKSKLKKERLKRC